jgi:hypothetical protein
MSASAFKTEREPFSAKIALAVFRSGAKTREQEDIHIVIQTAKPGVQPTDSKERHGRPGEGPNRLPKR